MKNIKIEHESENLVSAISGNDEAFERLVEPYRRELLVHCYRILGSLEDAEDLFQETLLRGWRHLDSFQGRSSFRAWLYKIATNACLDAIAVRKQRGLPRDLYSRGDPTKPLPPSSKEVLWIEPLPDELNDGQPDIYPEARYEVNESVRLAFIAALQQLPGRQRASLILCDVMGWSSKETAEILETTPAAVNSALQRARSTMKHANLKHKENPTRLDEQLTHLLTSYVAAWEAADSNALVSVLRADVALTMPPIPVWFSGRADIKTFLDGYLFRSADPFKVRLVAARFNGSPAYAVYQLSDDGIFRASAVQILTIENGEISEIHDFLTLDGKLFSRTGLSLIV